jgi:hypothetical protein
MLLKGVETVQIHAKTKIIAFGLIAMLVLVITGIILWHYQNTQEESITNISQTNQQTNKVSLAKNVSVNKPLPAKKPVDKPKEDVKDDKDIEQAVLQKEEVEQKKTTIDDVKKESGKDTKESEQAQQHELLRQQLANEIKTNLLIQIEQWNAMKTRLDMLGIRTDRSEADNKEFDYLQTTKRLEIEGEIMKLAFTYHRAYPEEGAIYYPDGWIGQLLKPIGMVFGKPGDSSPPSNPPSR